MDEDAGARRVVKALRDRGFDVVVGRELGNFGSDDEVHVEKATSLGRVLYTFNMQDFVRIHYAILAAGGSHAGIIVNPHQKMAIGTQLRRLIELAATFDSAGMRDRLEYI
jgi:hypothetical protein